MNATLPPELLQFVNREVATGKYQSAEDVVLEALRLLQEKERRLEALRREIDAGMRQIEQDQVIDLVGEKTQRAFFEDIKVRGKDRSTRRANGP